ncbi:hypothetical protein DVH26_34195 [Paenibacillus sp. H1-7]|uniref:hypothetical protein n=1 Tax=Paenibacillus sp. H1-7 TaxID=2282849 RepID=UPI001EF99AFE|nr:hypothetical protein [Paenibacillus sp. H1-7]ULL19040.1 hypothetical protein DVH26_34195 [Paenibacillus sp. H1-7]
MYKYNDIINILSPHTSNILVDKILYFEHGQYIYALKNVTIADMAFLRKDTKLYSSNLFLVIESLYQAIMLFCEISNLPKEIINVNMGAIDTSIQPGDTICIEITVIEKSDRFMKLEGKSMKDGQIIFNPNITIKLI